jgi:2-iminobutanoate/2-iminopropanoate deaminase
MTRPTPEVVHTEHAPKALGPYSQGIRVGGFVYTAGQGGIDPQTGQIVEGGVEAETRQVWRNLSAVLEASGSSLASVVKVNVYMVDLNDFGRMNAVYAEFFPTTKPARTTVQVAALPRGLLVEIDCVAVAPEQAG